MKNRCRKAFAVLTAVTALAFPALAYVAPTEGVSTSTTVVRGQWNSNFTQVKAFADANHIPLLMFYGSKSCGYCDKMIREGLNSQTFRDWQHRRNIAMCFMDLSSTPSSPAKTFVKGDNASTHFPYMRIYWLEPNGTVTGKSFSGRLGEMPDKKGSSIPQQLINSIEMYIADFTDQPPYAGGYFSQTNAPYASLQAENATAWVDVEIVREATAATNQEMKISAPGKAASVVTVTWAKDMKEQTVRLGDFDTKWFVEGKDVTLELMDGNDVASTVKIACATPANSAANPKWIGEDLGFGEWTMDLDAAKALAKNASGSAYTLVSVQGSLWCPDCANVDRNFLDIRDGSGNNRFAAWAKAKKIALVTVDIPNYNGPKATDYATPTLLSRTAYETTLAREREYPQSGADEALTHPMWRSGLGYLTRKMVEDADAANILERNHDLATKNTSEGGFHRPEDGNANRTGVPIFVLLRKDGTVAARLTRMANVSPMEADQTNFDNYLKRFEEMLWIADNNATEVENNYASAGSVSFRANGGSETATLSHCDSVDTFHLDGVGGNALQSVTVRGVSAAEVEVSFQTVDRATGKATTLGRTKTGKLSDGITLEQTFTEAGDYYVRVAAADITSEAFRLESATENHFIDYTVSGATVLEPQEDRATARAPEGSDKVTVRLTEGTVYRMTGLKSCADLQPLAGGAPGFFVATRGGNAEVTLLAVGGELAYQIWNSGEVGFRAAAREVDRSVCDASGVPLEIPVSRLGGKSGAVTVRVTVDPSRTTLASGRFWLTNTADRAVADLVWADGETADKAVRVWIEDDLLDWDEISTVALKAEVVASEAGDVSVADGKGEFTLRVIAKITGDPGRVNLTGTDPAYARKTTVYASASEGVVFRAARTDGNAGLVAVLFKSSYAGAAFETEDPRDIDDIEKEYPSIAELAPQLKGSKFLWWASRESGEKWVKVTGIPAGQSATITIMPVEPLANAGRAVSFTVVSFGDDAPAFEVAEKEVALTRYVETSVGVAVTGLQGGEVSVTKLSGTLPAGLKAAYSAERQSLVLSGAPTAKAGVYEPVYQVSEKRNGKKVTGLTVKLALVVTDPAAAGPNGEPALNPAVAKSRTFKGLPVYDESGKRLAGLLQVTVPPTGKASAKFTGADGTISFSAKAWSGCSPEGVLSASLVSRIKDAGGEPYGMDLEAGPNGAFSASLRGQGVDGLVVTGDGKTWKKGDSAEAWKGYYTVAVKHREVVQEGTEGVAPTGDGYLTLKMDSTSACNSGTFRVAGLLPNGTKISGSFTLALDEGKGRLPVFTKSSRDVFSALAGITANAVAEENRRCVESPEWCSAFWLHTEKSEAASCQVRLTLHGAYYDSSDDLGVCCAEDYERRDLNFYASGERLAPITVGEKTITVGPNEVSLKLTFTRSTGVITGAFKDPEVGSVKYAGVIVNGWGEGCGCGDYAEGTVFLPFMSGSCYYGGKFGSTKVTLGAAVKIDK